MKIISDNNNIEISEYLKFKNITNDSIENLKELKNKKSIVILGNFDGVHRAHKKIFKEAEIIGKVLNYNTVVYTFLEYPNNFKNRITTISEKLIALEENNMDYIFFDDFQKIKEYSPDEFIKNILIDQLNGKEIFCGFNYTFGKNKIGNLELMKKIVNEKYSGILNINPIDSINDNSGKVISSTRIRTYIENNDFDNIKNLLGHNYTIVGEVIHGKKLGREIGYPTANLKFKDKIYPQFGVYGAYLHISGDSTIYDAVINIGKNPTIDGNTLSIEAHILDFNEDIYGKIISIEILEAIRPERKMDSLNKLTSQIGEDIKIWRKRINEKYYDRDKNR